MNKICLTIIWSFHGNIHQEINQTAVTYFFDDNKSSYPKGYNLVQELFANKYGHEVQIGAGDYCKNWFTIPKNLNVYHHADIGESTGNPTIGYRFTAVTCSPIKSQVMQVPKFDKIC